MKRNKTRIVLACVVILAAVQQAIGQAQQIPAAASACMACHGPAALGPSLTGVVGRKAGSIPGFLYSRVMKGSDITWDEQTLERFIADPQQVVPGNRMPFAGLEDAAQRAEVVRYLKTLK
jgi:cytochrome c